MSRIVVVTWGSLGDLYPYVAIALELQKRGHDVVVATCPSYRQTVNSMGLGFHAVRPDCDWLLDEAKVRRMSHPRWGLLRVGRELLMASLPEAYTDTLEAAKDADLLVSMVASYATRLVAEKMAIPWVSAVHIPMGFFSGYDPPILEFSPFLSQKLRCLGPAFWKSLFWLGKRGTRFLAKPWYQQRAKIGLPAATEGNPLADSHSPLLVLALFSHLLSDQQPDWPSRTVLTGFPFFDDPSSQELPAPLHRFLDDGSPPIVFTLGTALGSNAGSYFEQAVACARLLNRRAVLVVGKGKHIAPALLSAEVFAVEFVPFKELFPRAAAVVHHGGIGTIAHAMRAGRPMLVVSHAWDQPDNAARAVRLGVARTISKSRYSAERAATELRQLLENPTYSQRALQVADEIRPVNGVQIACDALEKVLRK